VGQTFPDRVYWGVAHVHTGYSFDSGMFGVTLRPDDLFRVATGGEVVMDNPEFGLLEERARGAGLRLAEWVREALLAAPTEPGVDSGEVALAEVLALRSLLLNLHYRATGRPDPAGGTARADRAGGRREDTASASAHGGGADGGQGDRS
jgi:hypothetical protein